MTTENEAARQASEFLADLEQRHQSVLDELDQLNLRIEKVLDETTSAREPQTQPAEMSGNS